MSVMCLSDGSHWPATTAEYQKKKKRYISIAVNMTETVITFLQGSAGTQTVLDWLTVANFL